MDVTVRGAQHVLSGSDSLGQSPGGLGSSITAWGEDGDGVLLEHISPGCLPVPSSMRYPEKYFGWPIAVVINHTDTIGHPLPRQARLNSRLIPS